MFVRNSPFQDYNVATKFEDTPEEPSLLEELGINPAHIRQKTLGVFTFRKVEDRLLEEPDMAGPLLFVFVFGGLLLLAGKMHFGAIYGFGLLGSMGIYGVMNLMAQVRNISLYLVVSILGYALLPIVLLSAVGVFVSLNGTLGAVSAAFCVGWSTVIASKFFETCLEMKEQRWLVAYPTGLMYACFTLLTVF